MKDFDEYLKRKASEEQTEIPESVIDRIEDTLASLPEEQDTKKRIRMFPRIAAAVACFIFVSLFLLPNISTAYAQSLEQLPVIGNIVRVITIRNYFYSDDYHELNVDVPEIKDENSTAYHSVNKTVKELTDRIVSQFYDDLDAVGNNGHGSVYVDYEVVTDTSCWFTLKLRVVEAAGSSNTYYKYYHIDKSKDALIRLGNVIADESGYSVLEEEIVKQMKDRMTADSSVIYWTEDSVMGQDFVSLSDEHNFYFNEKGELVIPFDKYEVAPGFMGTPEFTISGDVLKNVIKSEYADIIKATD